MEDNALIVSVEYRGVKVTVDRLKVGGFRTLQWLSECTAPEPELSNLLKLIDRIFGESVYEVMDAFESEYGHEPLPQEMLTMALEFMDSLSAASSCEPKN